MDILKKLNLLFLLTTLTACQMGYLLDSGYHQAKILHDRVPVEKVLNNKNTSDLIKNKVKLAIDVKKFAEDQLQLAKTNNYTTYTQLDQPYVSYALRVAHAYRLKNYTWKFPLIGEVPYKGYFKESKAKDEAKVFKKKGYDTFVRGIPAYSTLGYLEDSILSSFTNYSDHGLADLIIHETVHSTCFIKDHVDFNEQLASFIGAKGSEEYFKSKGGKSSPQLRAIRRNLNDDYYFSKFIKKELTELDKWYSSNKGSLTWKKKQQRLKDIQVRFKWQVKNNLRTEKYKWFETKKLNNAILMSYKTYSNDKQLFQKAYNKLGKSIPKFMEFCKTLEGSDDPKVALTEFTLKK